MIARLKAEPAVVIGVLAAIILATVQSLGGADLLSGTLVDWVTRALNPDAGWAIPIIVAIVTRFFVSPATSA